MALTSVSFKNYKAFKEEQNIKLRPITILIGKNSSGKSAIAKLFTLLENSLSGNLEETLLLKNNDVELGGELLDLVFNRQLDNIKFEINQQIKIEILIDNNKATTSIYSWEDAVNNIRLEYDPNTKQYKGIDGDAYRCIFKGFIPIEIIDKNGKNILETISYKHLSIDVDYMGPFRVLPPRQFHLTGQVKYKNTGVKGENAYAMLGVSFLQRSNLQDLVGKWYKDNFDGWELFVKHESSSPYFEIMLKKDDTDVNLVDVGQGMNQALPLVVRAFKPVANSIIVLEQPELHLHPVAHANLAELFTKSAKEHNQTFVIETHSENMLLRFRKLIVEKKYNFTNQDFVIYWVENSLEGGQEIREITVNENGVLSDWPDGVFSENLQEIIEMQKIINQKQKSI